MRLNTLRALLIALVVALTAPAARQARADDALRDGIEALLAGIDDAPTASDWRAAAMTDPAQAAAVLLEIARDTSRTATTRARAVTGLRYLSDDALASGRVPQALATIALDTGAPVIVRRKAVGVLGVVDPSRLVDDVAPATLAASDTDLRIATVTALAALPPSKRADALLETRLEVEPSTVVRERIQTALRGAPSPTSPGTP